MIRASSCSAIGWRGIVTCVVGVCAIAGAGGCQEAEAKREALPPPAPPSQVGTTFGGSAEDEVPRDSDFKRSFALADLAPAGCVSPSKDGSWLAKGCGQAAVLFGPYARAPKGSTVVVKLNVEGVSGSTVLVADIVSHAGSRIHAWASEQPLKAGDQGVIEFGVLLDASATDFETRLWSQSADKAVSFKIMNASVETRVP